jgi:5,10-methylenetetrahydromethanopterin reductase
MTASATLPSPPRKVALGFLGGPYTVQEMTRAVELAEQSGFESAWMANDIGGRDPYIALARWAAVTERLRLGVAVSNPYTRHPVELAQTIATLDEASGGRSILGLGTGASWRSLIAGRWTKPLAYLKESVQVMRELWSLPATTFQGAPVSIRDSDWIWPTETTIAFRSRIPIYVGAGGPQMTRLAARIGDGLLIAIFKFLSTIEAQVKLFRAAAQEFGRESESLEIAPLIGIWVAQHPSEFDVMRRVIAFELSRLNEAVAVEQGLEIEPFRVIKEIYARHSGTGEIVKYGRERAAFEAAPYVTDTMLRAFALVGTVDECVNQMKRYIAIGVTLPILVPLGGDISKVIQVGTTFAACTEPGDQPDRPQSAVR